MRPTRALTEILALTVRPLLQFAAIVGLPAAIYVIGMPRPHLRPFVTPAAVVVGSIATSWLMRFEERRHYTRVFGTRVPIAPEEVFASRYKDTGITGERFVQTWTRCAQLLGIPASLLRPDDRLAVELAPTNALDGMNHPIENVIDLVARCERRDQIKALRLETFGELVRWLAERADPPPTPWERLAQRFSSRPRRS